jgi:sterol desaturase/sphingolipid hydroxylase (fatty acid hydroxylase superfamily)
VANALLVALAFWFDSYFTLFTGFYSGFVYYCFMHVLLHKPWAKKVFPLLQASHIHHHCKYPDRCFGISITWWDHLFNTAVSREVKISEKVLQFYFGERAH